MRSLKGKMLLVVSLIVMGSGLLITVLATQRYGSSLREAMAAQAENLAHAVALEAVDKILTKDLVALQKTLDHHQRTHPSIAYLFIVRDGEILAHTFPGGIPVDLLDANGAESEKGPGVKRISSTGGEHYLDIAWPILEARAGLLRFGYSEKIYDRKIRALWLQMGVVSLGILLVGLVLGLLFVRKITSPLEALSEAAQRIDQGELGLRARVFGRDEVGKLALSFNEMVTRIEDYTHRLEQQSRELERAHQQTRSLCSVVQEVGSCRNLGEMGRYLSGKFREIITSGHQTALILRGQNTEILFVLSTGGVEILEDPEHVRTFATAVATLKKTTVVRRTLLSPPLVPDAFGGFTRQVIVPLANGQRPLGALVVVCPVGCTCREAEVEAAGLILTQAGGIIRRAVLQEEEAWDSRKGAGSQSEFSGIVGKDPKMQTIYKLIEDIAPTDVTVLIQGESGTGKELAALAVHQNSPRRTKPFIVINCSAYPATLLESELFGHEKGAFTGATRKKPGRFEQAHGGTVFLDEIGEISPSAQIKLLRVLQTQEFERLGGEETLNVDIRILAATNKDLVQEVIAGRFREDLYYRLNVIPLNLPPLRERRNDIPLLTEYFVRFFGELQKKEVRELSPEVMRILLDYAWPGNVRELKNALEHAMVLAKGLRIEETHLPYQILHAAGNAIQLAGLPTMAENEKAFLRETLEKCGGNKKKAAQHLGISRNTLYEKLKRYRIQVPATH